MNYILLIVFGRILISTVMGLPPARKMSVKWLDGWFIELFHCDHCLGTYIYFILFAFFHFEITTFVGLGYIPIVSEGLSAVVVAWAVHLFTVGFKTKYFEVSI